MPKQSAGLLLYRGAADAREVLLVHPGGPFWARKDLGAWTIPKGEPLPGEDLLAAAQREFHEETSFTASGPFYPLGTVQQAGGKLVAAWAFPGDCDPRQLRSNECEIEWPPRSGRRLTIPEVDRGAWFTLTDARAYLLKGQLPFLDRLAQIAL